jgi:c-di-GMP-binding flagellar brake protein YcgR
MANLGAQDIGRRPGGHAISVKTLAGLSITGLEESPNRPWAMPRSGMIKDTLIALVRAGDDALAAVQSGAPAGVRVEHLPGAAIVGPLAVAIGVRNGPFDRAYLSADAQLAATSGNGFANLCEVFTRAFANRSPTPRTMAIWRALPDDVARPELHGPRCFGLTFADRRGRLTVLTEVFSRGTYETVRASSYEEEVARHYLPANLATRQALERELEVHGALGLAGRLELDLLVTAGDDGAEPVSCRGILLARHREQDGGGVVLSLDASEEARDLLAPGRLIGVEFGLRGRVFHWRSRVVRHADVSLVRDAAITALTVATPRAIEVSQRRREFRIAAPEGMVCRIRVTSPTGPQTEDEYGFQVVTMPDDTLAVDVADLSFSGAGLIGEEALARAFPPDSRLEFWLGLPGRGGPLCVQAVVRQSSVVLTGRNRRQGRLGVEFQPCGEAERRAREAIEQHVMSVERQLAFQRALAAERQVL